MQQKKQGPKFTLLQMLQIADCGEPLAPPPSHSRLQILASVGESRAYLDSGPVPSASPGLERGCEFFSFKSSSGARKRKGRRLALSPAPRTCTRSPPPSDLQRPSPISGPCRVVVDSETPRAAAAAPWIFNRASACGVSPGSPAPGQLQASESG